jgi:hypothetical protein
MPWQMTYMYFTVSSLQLANILKIGMYSHGARGMGVHSRVVIASA